MSGRARTRRPTHRSAGQNDKHTKRGPRTFMRNVPREAGAELVARASSAARRRGRNDGPAGRVQKNCGNARLVPSR
ncbi:hypothetical protein WL01_12985 [Burkholderia ubonensis]|nr:hypothetical protein WL01_12985 [Burkholderia ubonensis]KWB14583.1 hypothetical protein WL33_10370 [Burkholderia ubonensis]KWC31864.1 hypothetical protein WL50_01925 [Burkholderia ubonensis]